MKEIFEKIDSCCAPPHWKRDQPNKVSKDNAKKITDILFKKYGMTPDIIAASIEKGIYFRYNLGKKDHDLIFETYNDSDIGCIITKNRDIVFNFDFDLKVNIGDQLDSIMLNRR